MSGGQSGWRRPRAQSSEMHMGILGQAALLKAGVGRNDLVGLNFGGEKTLTVKR